MLIAGIGRSDITPPVGIAHAGWGASTHECAEGVDMPLYCTALYVAEGDTRALIIDFDLTGIREPLDSQIRPGRVRCFRRSRRQHTESVHPHACGPGIRGTVGS